MPFTFPYYYERHCLVAGNSPLLILNSKWHCLTVLSTIPSLCHCLNAVYIPLPLQKSLHRCCNSPLLIINDTASLSTVPHLSVGVSPTFCFSATSHGMAESKFHEFHTTGTEADHESCSVYTTDAEVKKKKRMEKSCWGTELVCTTQLIPADKHRSFSDPAVNGN